MPKRPRSLRWNPQHTHAHGTGGGAESAEPSGGSTRVWREMQEQRELFPARAPESASSPRSRGPSQPLQSPVWRISPLPLPAPHSGKFLTIFVPNREPVAGLRAFPGWCLFTRQSVLLALTKMSFFSLFCGSGWGWFVFISWLIFLRVRAVYPHEQ